MGMEREICNQHVYHILGTPKSDMTTAEVSAKSKSRDRDLPLIQIGLGWGPSTPEPLSSSALRPGTGDGYIRPHCLSDLLARAAGWAIARHWRDREAQ